MTYRFILWLEESPVEEQHPELYVNYRLSPGAEAQLDWWCFQPEVSQHGRIHIQGVMKTKLSTYPYLLAILGATWAPHRVAFFRCDTPIEAAQARVYCSKENRLPGSVTVVGNNANNLSTLFEKMNVEK